MMELTAEWKSCVPFFHKANAQKVAQEILAIGASATPAQIVDKARDPKTELHRLFEWDDAKAAEKYRLTQARTIVCSLVIKETVQDERPPIRFLYKPENGAGYQPTVLIVQNKDKYQSLLESALRELSAFRVKYHALSELETIFDEIEELTK